MYMHMLFYWLNICNTIYIDTVLYVWYMYLLYIYDAYNIDVLQYMDMIL